MTKTHPDQPSTNPSSLSVWLKQNRRRLQALALVLLLGMPFWLYWALQSGRDGLAVLSFAIIVASLTVVMVAG